MNIDGTTLRTIRSDRLVEPVCVAADAARGRLAVADNGARAVFVFDKHGNIEREVAIRGRAGDRDRYLGVALLVLQKKLVYRPSESKFSHCDSTFSATVWNFSRHLFLFRECGMPRIYI